MPEEIPVSTIPQLPIKAESGPKKLPNFTPFLDTLQFLDLSPSVRIPLTDALGDECAKALIHGKIHTMIEAGNLWVLQAMPLIMGLQNSTDRFDIQIEELTKGQRRRYLAEDDPLNCFDICFGDMPETQKRKIKNEEAKLQAKVADEAVSEADILGELLSQGITVKEAGKKYKRSPFLLGELAKQYDRINGGDQGLQELMEIYPPIPGMPDPQEVAKKIISGF